MTIPSKVLNKTNFSMFLYVWVVDCYLGLYVSKNTVIVFFIALLLKKMDIKIITQYAAATPVVTSSSSVLLNKVKLPMER